MKKPLICQTCPAYGNGEGFVPDEMCIDAPYFVVFEQPSKAAAKTGRIDIDADWLALASIERGTGAILYEEGVYEDGDRVSPPFWETQFGNASIGHAMRCPNTLTGNDQKDAVARCRQHDRIPGDVTLFVSVGDVAMHVTTDLEGKVESWRGAILSR